MKKKSRPRRINVRSVGCKLNQSEAEHILERFRDNGFVPAEKDCDLCVLNTCTVTEKADRKSRALLYKLRRENPGAKILVTGCYATTDPEIIRHACSSSVIVPNAEKDRIVELACASWFPDRDPAGDPGSIAGFSSRTRPFVKIQDGCDLRCSYCKVWMARGPSKSVPSDRIVEQARILSRNGHPEMVLTGVNITDYRDGKLRLPGLLKKLLAERLPLRYRLGSLEPQRVDDELLEAVSDGSVCDHFHLFLQSGSDVLLKKMNRSYSVRCFADAVGRLRRARPDAGIGVDVIAGFPGETESSFRETSSLLRELAVPFMHVFRYSDRQGTPAASFAGKVDEPTRTLRSRELSRLQREQEYEFRSRFKGRILEIVVEAKRGLASNYISVDLPGPLAKMKYRLVRVVVKGVTRTSTLAEPVEKA